MHFISILYSLISLLPLSLLPPVAFDPDVPATAAVPVARHPARVRMWRLFIATRNPHIRMPVPAMVPGVPGPVAVLWWRRRNYLNRARWWGSNPDHDLSARGYSRRQENAPNSCKHLFSHRSSSPSRGSSPRDNPFRRAPAGESCGALGRIPTLESHHLFRGSDNLPHPVIPLPS
jgi:hypothetical protein